MYDIAAGEAKGFSLQRREADGTVRPLPVVIVRTHDNRYFGYANRCPHTSVWLNVRSGGYLTEDGTALVCSRHGARFDIEDGLCLEGPCKGEALERFFVAAISGDVCLLGVDLVDDDADTTKLDGEQNTLDITIGSG